MLNWLKFFLFVFLAGIALGSIFFLPVARAEPPVAQMVGIVQRGDVDQQLGKIQQWAVSHDREQDQLARQVTATEGIVRVNSERISHIETSLESLLWWSRSMALVIFTHFIFVAFEKAKVEIGKMNGRAKR
jgi:hypothetical protein